MFFFYWSSVISCCTSFYMKGITSSFLLLVHLIGSWWPWVIITKWFQNHWTIIHVILINQAFYIISIFFNIILRLFYLTYCLYMKCLNKNVGTQHWNNRGKESLFRKKYNVSKFGIIAPSDIILLYSIPYLQRNQWLLKCIY